MNRYFVAAGALLLGTSALAWAADTNTVKDPLATSGVESVKTVDGAAKIADKDAVAAKAASAEKLAWPSEATDAKLAMASSTEVSDKTLLASEETAPKLQNAAYETWSDDPADPLMASAVQADTVNATGMGGASDAMASASLAPRPAADDYPPCDPGPGDDRCIQLYEPGVRAQLASWNSPTGGLADGSATTAMGGPYEPIESHADASASAAVTGTYPAAGDAAMNDDGMTDSAMGETMDPGMASTGYATADATAYQGVGGPVEAQSGYPPCSPGPGDDRCIQLYERGVTGAGN